MCALRGNYSPDQRGLGCFASLRSAQGLQPLEATPIPARVSLENGFGKTILKRQA